MIADFTPIVFPEIEAETKESQKRKSGSTSFVNENPHRQKPKRSNPGYLIAGEKLGATEWEIRNAKEILNKAPELLSQVTKLGGLSNTAKEARKRSASKSKVKSEPTTAELRKRREAMLDGMKRPWLTPEQVDPDFKGTSQEFMDKYGHVHILTKTQREEDADKSAFSAWVAAFRGLNERKKRKSASRSFVTPKPRHKTRGKDRRAFCDARVSLRRILRNESQGAKKRKSGRTSFVTKDPSGQNARYGQEGISGHRSFVTPNPA